MQGFVKREYIAGHIVTFFYSHTHTHTHTDIVNQSEASKSELISSLSVN